MNRNSSPMRPELALGSPVSNAPSRPQRKRALTRWGVRIVVASVAFTGLAGALHLPFARPLLRMISPATVCPIMRGSPEQIDRAHAVAAAAIRSSAVAAAPARPALGFELDKTKKSDVLAWAVARKIPCASIAGNDNLQRCGAMPAAALGQPDDFGELEEVTFEFRSTGELVHVQTLRRHLSPTNAASIVSRIEDSMAAVLGAPTTTGGAPTALHLSHGALSTYTATHTFTDYRATVTATNLAQTGVMVREEYLSTR